jgi:hypothetical protein
MSSDAAFFNSDIHRLVADVSVRKTACEARGELSRAVHLAEAREALLRALNTPGRDERQLSLDAATHAKGN